MFIILIIAVILFIALGKSQSDLIGAKNRIERYLNQPNTSYIERYPNAVIDTTWEAHKKKIQKDGRTLDRSRNLITTSEGQSYSLLRSVWMNDKDTFDRVWTWTKNNLQKRNEDKLFSWKWGQSKNNKWEVLKDEGGYNSASDADIDIALALIFAYERWGKEAYLQNAKDVLNDIWKKEVVIINNKPYLTAGNWAVAEDNPTINLSYLSPAHFEVFYRYNSENNWKLLKQTSYEILENSSTNNLGYGDNTNLPSDWVSISKKDGSIGLSTNKNQTSDFSDDAIRVPFRVALDYIWHKDERALQYLNRLSFLKDEWVNNKKIYAGYSKDGKVTEKYESNSLYGATLPYFVITNSEIAKEIYLKKLGPLYNPDLEEFKNLGYYDENWVWFGIAFYNQKLVNLANK